MLYQPTSKLVMTDDTKRNQNILESEASQVGKRLVFAFENDFVIDPQNGCNMYAPGWQKTHGLDWNNVFVSYFSLRS